MTNNFILVTRKMCILGSQYCTLIWADISNLIFENCKAILLFLPCQLSDKTRSLVYLDLVLVTTVLYYSNVYNSLSDICGWNKITKLVLFSDYLSLPVFQTKLILKMFYPLIHWYLNWSDCYKYFQYNNSLTKCKLYLPVG